MVKKNKHLEEANLNEGLKHYKDRNLLAELKRPLDHKAELRKAKQLEKDAHYQNKEALSVALWKKVRDDAQDIISMKQMGYDNPVAIMMNIIQTSVARNKAIYSHNSLAHFLYRTVPEWIGSKLLDHQWFGSEKDRLPGLKHFVEFNDDNTLNIKYLIRDNHNSNPIAATRNMVRGNTEDEFTREQVLAFQAIVVAWLEECHECIADEANPGKFTKNGVELTKKDFDEYIDYNFPHQVKKSLESYLKEKLENVDVQDLRPRP